MDIDNINTIIDVLTNCSPTIIEPKNIQTQDLGLICPALQPIQTTVNVPTAEKIENNIKSKFNERKILYSCCKCRGHFHLKDLFVYEESDNISDKKPICLVCSKEVDDVRKLRDWTDIYENDVKKECSRCKNTKSLTRFTENNKYCDFCLLKKRWSRMKTKYETTYERKRRTINPDLVKCCKCSKLCKRSVTFAYIEQEYYTRYICLNCSVDVADWRKLRDWEEETGLIDSRMCSRCKKHKSLYRFNEGKSGCEYCSLKRKRLYLVQKRMKEKDNLNNV